MRLPDDAAGPAVQANALSSDRPGAGAGESNTLSCGLFRTPVAARLRIRQAYAGGAHTRTTPGRPRGLGGERQGGFWFATYNGALNGESFVGLLKKRMHRRRKPLHLLLDGLPAHKKAVVRDYVTSAQDKLTLHFLPGYAPDLNPDELVWSHAKRTGQARRPLQQGEKLEQRISAPLTEIGNDPALVRSFFRHPSVSYISDL